jgi:hypothetical protein
MIWPPRIYGGTAHIFCLLFFTGGSALSHSINNQVAPERGVAGRVAENSVEPKSVLKISRPSNISTWNMSNPGNFANCASLASRTSFENYIQKVNETTGFNSSLLADCKSDICNALWGDGNADISGVGVSFAQSSRRIPDAYNLLDGRWIPL